MGLPSFFVRADQVVSSDVGHGHESHESSITEFLVTLEPTDSSHLVRSLRAREGEMVTVVVLGPEHTAQVKAMKSEDGRTSQRALFAHVPTSASARVLQTTVLTADPKRAVLKVLSEQQVTSGPPQVTIALFLPRITTFETILKCVTELGADEIIGIEGRYSEVSESQIASKLERFNKMLLESAKQSRRYFLPTLRFIAAEIFFSEITGISSGTRLVVLDKRDEQPALKGAELSSLMEQDIDRIITVVGPEGGFSDHEKKAFQELKATVLQISHNRLRTETAACAGLGVIMEALMSKHAPRTAMQEKV